MRKGLKFEIERMIEETVGRNMPDYKHCEFCGCAVHSALAIKGKSEIRVRPPIPPRLTMMFEGKMCDPPILTRGYLETEYIYTPYYCKLHAPKTDEEAGRK